MIIAFVFPGQGSQSLGMMAELASSYPTVESTFAEASDVLGYDLWQLVQDGPEAELNKTTMTQPALLASSVATWRVWNEISQIKAVMMAGHSLGEYSALVCSDAISFTDAIQLVADRGAYMQDAVPEGTGSMAAVLGLEDKQIEEVCEQAAQGQIVSAANYNSAGQVVIAGHKEAVERAVELAKAAGAKRTVILPVSVPSHCALMQEAADQFAQRLDTIKFNQSNVPVLQNVDATSRENVEDIKLALQQQLCQPVRWVKTIQEMVKQNVDTVIECGPGKVLSGLIKRIDRSLNILPIFDPASLDKARAELTA
ncbi:MAG: [acyl-carrier-protein] S-malonyltransferase [Gammaproteobacteria bacterium]|jgi:[acyl-carrier-protein] S-malonyltransferase